jgi:hypothetical protein
MEISLCFFLVTVIFPFLLSYPNLSHTLANAALLFLCHSPFKVTWEDT